MNELETHPLFHQTRRVLQTLRVFALTILNSEYFSAALILFGLSFLVFARALVRPNLIVSGSDFVQFYFWEGFTRAELAQWRLPQWNPFFFSGYPFLANPQMMVFYPPAWFLRFFPLDYSFGLGMMLHIGWAGLGMYALSREAGVNRAGSLAAAIAFMLCGFLIPRIQAGHLDIIYGTSWLPWNVLLWRKLLGESRRRWYILVAIGMTMQFLAGFPSIVLMTAIILAIASLPLMLPPLLRGEWKTVTRMLGRAALSVILTLAFSAPQLLPTLEFARLSTRANGVLADCDKLFALTFVDFATLVLVKTPFDVFLVWERVMYFGALPLLFALFALKSSSEMTRWRNLLLVVAIVGVVLGFGSSVPFYNLIPLITFFRVPSQFILLICFSGAGLAGIGFERVIEQSRIDSRGLRWFVVLTLTVAVIAIIFDVMLYRARPQSYDPSFYGWMSWLASFSSPRYLLTLLSLWMLNWVPHLTGLAEFNTRQIVNRPVRCCRSALLLTVLYVDLWFFSYIVISILPAPYQVAPVPNVFPFEARILTIPYSSADRSMATRVANAQGYAPVVLKSYNDFVSADRPPSRCPDFEHAEIDSGDERLLKLLSVSVLDLNGVAKELKNYYPRAAWVGEAVSAPTNGDAIKWARAADFDPTKKVIIEGEVNPSASNGTGSIRITQYGTESLNVLIDSTSEGWFYINDVWYPGWKAWVNGEETPVYRANGTFRAVRVSSGQHTVFMKYESSYLGLGIWIAAVMWTVIGAMMCWKLLWRFKLGEDRQS